MISSTNAITGSKPSVQGNIYRGKKIGGVFLILFFSILVLGVIYPLLNWVRISTFAYTEFGPSKIFAWSINWLGFSSINLFILIVLFIYRLLRAYPIVQINQYGLSIKYLMLRNKILPWNEISGIQELNVKYCFWNIPIYYRQSIIIHLQNGKLYVIKNNIQNYPDLKLEVKNIIYSLLYPQFEQKFLSGKDLSFAFISINRDKLVFYPDQPIKKKSLPWSTITDLHVDRGFLFVGTSQGKIRKKVFKIPTASLINFELFLKLVRKEVL